MSASEIKTFIQYIAPIIRAEADRRGYRICSTVIAQAIIEGRYGTSTLARPPFFNHFGLKCGTTWKGRSVNLKTKEEYTPGTLTTIKDNFRAYDDDIAGVAGYYDFISTKRYANLKYAADYRQYAEYLNADGYATSSTYVQSLCDTVKKYNLWTWDDKEVSSERYFPKCSENHTSITQALDEIGVDSSKANRKLIYNANFTDVYRYTAKQNMSMLILLKQGLLIKP